MSHGHIFISPDSDAVLSTDSFTAKHKHDQLRQSVEIASLARTIIAPTDDLEVRNLLRQFTQPVTLFGERPSNRRERLQFQLAEAKVKHRTVKFERPLEITNKAAVKRTDSEGTEHLGNARRLILSYSLSRANDRLSSQKDYINNSNIDYNNLVTDIGCNRPLSACSFVDRNTKNNLSFVLGDIGGNMKYFSVSQNNVTNILNLFGHQNKITDIQTHPYREYKSSNENIDSSIDIASSCIDGIIHLWKLPKEGVNEISPLCKLQDPNDSERIPRLLFHPSGKFLFCTSYNGAWKMWDIETSQLLLTQYSDNFPLFSISLHNDGSILATGDIYGNTRVWDLRTGQSIITLKNSHLKHITSLSWSRRGLLATGSSDNSIKIWDIRKHGSLFTSILGHTNLITDLKFDPHSDSFLISSSFDRFLKIWDVNNHFSLLKSLVGHSDKIIKFDLSDSQTILSISYDKIFKLWYRSDL